MNKLLRMHIKIIPQALSLLFFAILILFLRAIPSFGIKIHENNKPLHYLAISDKIYYRQTFNNCAPYTAMGVINVLRNE
ncbi:MAG: hypothetical protein LBI06_06260 [Treponema sp.]|nr:hypothetical protein [Treponema sp.]